MWRSNFYAARDVLPFGTVQRPQADGTILLRFQIRPLASGEKPLPFLDRFALVQANVRPGIGDPF
jgi:hypothetical protein